jgi:hypothetical protein
MSIEPGQAALLLALAVTLHNAEEMIWLPGLSNPYLPKLEVGPVAFRFAAAAIAVLFWLAAFALLSGAPIAGVLAGFAAAMIFNAFMPHLALTLAMRRYHPGTATAWLLVVPAAVTVIAASGGLDAFANRAFALEAVAGFLGLAVSLPLLLMLGGIIERRLAGLSS